MAWIGVTLPEDGRFDAAGLGATVPENARGPIANDALLSRGTLMIEARLSPLGRPQTLLAFRHSHPWTGSVSLRALPGGGIVLTQNIDNDMRHVTLHHGHDARADLVRISYSWDVDLCWGRLTLEYLADGSMFSCTTNAPHPMPLADVRMVTHSPALRDMDHEVVFAAIADHIHPIGPLPGLCGATPLLTPAGPVPVARLRRGDTLLTSDGDIVPILQTVRMTVPAHGSFCPVRLRAPFFDLRHDIHVAPHQRLVVGGSQVEYMFGAEAVLVPARHLVNRSSAFFAIGPDVVTYHHVLLPEHKSVVAADCPVESLYVGRLRRKPEALNASVLAHCSQSRLPEHARPVWPVLKPIEAITLAQTRAA